LISAKCRIERQSCAQCYKGAKRKEVSLLVWGRSCWLFSLIGLFASMHGLQSAVIEAQRARAEGCD
jgi:hypothetical protein